MDHGPSNCWIVIDPPRLLLVVTVDPNLPVTTVEARALTGEEWEVDHARKQGGR
jgi:hypothetical protein